MGKQKKPAQPSDESERPTVEQEPPEDTEPARGKVSFSTTLSREEAVAYFEAIVDGLRKGTVTFRQAEQAVSMSVPEHLNIEVKAARKSEKSKIFFEISWHGSGGAELTIVS